MRKGKSGCFCLTGKQKLRLNDPVVRGDIRRPPRPPVHTDRQRLGLYTRRS